MHPDARTTLPAGPAWPGGPSWQPTDAGAILALPDGERLAVSHVGGLWAVEQGHPGTVAACHFEGPSLVAAVAVAADVAAAWREWDARED